MKVEWVSPAKDNIIGNSLGYGLANINLRAAAAKVMELDWRSDVALHFTHPQFYFSVPRRKNVILTMCEHSWLTEDYEEAFKRVDLIITVSQFCKSVFEKYTDKPVYVVPLGVNPNIWHAKRRVLDPRKKFRFLYCGAPNLRKFSIMESAWRALMDGCSNVELYIKTTGADIPEELGSIVRSNNWIVDNRKLPVRDLVKLYHSAHAFLLLHLGEGYSLSAIEAQCTQMPLIISDHTGSMDFCNVSNSFPVKVDPGKIEVITGSGHKTETKVIDAGIPNIISAMTQMATVMRHYGRASEVARQAAKDARKLTWDNSAKRLKEVLDSSL